MTGSGAEPWLVAAAATASALEEAVQCGDWAAAALADAQLRHALEAGPGSPAPVPRVMEIARRHAAALELARAARTRLLEAGASLSASRHGTGRYLEVARAD